MDRLRPNRLAQNVLAVAVVVTAAAAAYAWWDSRQEREQAIERAYVAAELVALSLGEHAVHSFDMAAGLLEIVDEMVRERGGPAKIRPTMSTALARELYGVENAYQTLMVLDVSGRTLASSWHPTQRMPGDIHAMITRPFRDNVNYSGIAVSRAFTSAVTGELVVALTKGYHEPDGRLSAVLGVTVRLSHFQNAYDRVRAASGAPQALSLFDLDAYLLVRSPPPVIGALNTVLPGSKQNLDDGLAAPRGRLRLVAPRDGQERLAVVHRVGEYPFVVGVSTQVSEALAAWQAHARQSVGAVALFGGLLLVLAAMLARQASQLAHSQELMRLATRGARVGIWDRDLRQDYAYRSPEMLGMLGVPPDSEEARAVDLMLNRVHPEDRAALEEMRNVMRSGQIEPYTGEFRLLCTGGRHCWFQCTGVAVEFEGERPVRIAGTLVNVDQRRHAQDEVRALAAGLERKVGERTRELELVVRELESFSYSVSHDLRAPVRHVNSFGKLAQEALEQQDATTAGTYLARVMKAGTHMDHVIQHLLMLARVGRTQPQVVPVDLSAVARETLKRLQDGEPGRHVEVSIDTGLRAKADPGLVAVVMENLLSNAWKFTRPKGSAAKVEVGLANVQGAPSFYVRDNGVGFDPGRAERLFQPFTRMHSESEFEGTGIGLATVKRAVERQGGTIRADSAPGVGTTIFFTLPQ